MVIGGPGKRLLGAARWLLPCALALLVLGVIHAGATESGSLSWRARNLFSQGKYAESFMLFTRAVDASRKEADLHNERRIQINLALIYTHSEEWASADSVLMGIRPADLSPEDYLRWLQVRLLSLNLREQYEPAVKAWQEHGPPTASQRVLHSQVALEAAIAAAGLGRQEQAQEWLEQAVQVLRKEAPGLVAASRGMVAARLKQYSQAEPLLLDALELSRRSRRTWETGRILGELAEVAQGRNQRTISLEFHRRAFLLYEQLGLPRPYVRHLAIYLEQQPGLQDKDLSIRLANTRKLLEAPTAIPALLTAPAPQQPVPLVLEEE